MCVCAASFYRRERERVDVWLVDILDKDTVKT